MVLNVKQTTVAYRCPECGSGVLSPVGVFSLSGDMVKLKCSCKNSDMSIVHRKDNNTVRLTVPCIFCSKPHTFTVNTSLFFSKELFVLPCPYSDINIGFVGEENAVKSELARTELELLDMLEESGIQDFKGMRGDDDVITDSQIVDIVTFVVRDLDAEGKIFCTCHPNGREPLPDGVEQREDCTYDVEFTNDGIKVTCTECGDSALIPTDSLLTAHAFLNSEKLVLGKNN
ncbi:MAG: hypothetical protein E7667_05825 [Ruminococcaceae bacterium]|nr:hypothetical protein [Oscillospiraceae bacterium]